MLIRAFAAHDGYMGLGKGFSRPVDLPLGPSHCLTQTLTVTSTSDLYSAHRQARPKTGAQR
jgi:hypothetical protein